VNSSSPIRFTVIGVPQPGGSKRHVGNGVIIDANRKAKPWKSAVAAFACAAYSGPLLTGALEVSARFYLPRPKGHYGTGRNEGVLKASAPRDHTKKPDTTKLWRSTEDALKGVLWRDDSQVVMSTLSKQYGEPARVEIEVITRR